MKRKGLIRYLTEKGCIFEHEGKKHTLFYNPQNGRSATVPRHNEINTFTAKGICKDLGIEVIRLK
ncbi:MAG: type II toxin-antitoxin system HicA family toxin [Planctomycetota bacterium]|nr:type II toxin-antitoxin system HicA family toxin [Planctomycetota bacterium]MDI6787196.1 type II toxin-antitoxin system HicA family toxin [Planctomycetota bacterium]